MILQCPIYQETTDFLTNFRENDNFPDDDPDLGQVYFPVAVSLSYELTSSTIYIIYTPSPTFIWCAYGEPKGTN